MEVVGSASVPAGASRGKHEAVELRDKDINYYQGKGVKMAIKHIHDTIEPHLKGMHVMEQWSIDQALIKLDGTKNKSKLGANTILGVSLAVAHTAAASLELPFWRYVGGILARTLPVPMVNIINGGAHATNNLDFQEFMIMPIGFERFSEALRSSVEIFHTLKKILEAKKYSTAVGDEGGFAPDLKNNEEAIEVILSAIEKSGYTPGKHIYIALDPAASEFFDHQKNHYILKKSSGKIFNSEELVAFWDNWVKKYPIFSIEDGLAEDDWDGWRHFNQKLGHQLQLVGDDLFVTNQERLQRGIQSKAANAILIKLNQIGTLSETLKTIQIAQRNGYQTIISHRSGETEDTTIADLAVATQSGQIKCGAPSRSERVAKYNALLRIEEELDEHALYLGEKLIKERFVCS